ncbi:MAG: hypothetical protein V1747_03580 [Candidatus Omnitrophota bacterium]
MNNNTQNKENITIYQRSLIMEYRPISDMIRLFVIPEIEKRIELKKISKTDLPIEINSFRAYQVKKENGSIENIVELNEEVNIQYRLKLKEGEFTEDMVGTTLKLSELDPNPDVSFIIPPDSNGIPCAYAFLNRVFLTPHLVFDFSPNAPDFSEKKPADLKFKYPIVQLLYERNFVKNIKPFEKMQKLKECNWPPSPDYYPEVFIEMHNSNTDSPADTIQKKFNETYWNNKITFWKEASFFNNRISYIEKSIQAYLKEDYVASIYIICPQFEGIIRDYLYAKYGNAIDGWEYKKKIDKLQELVISRKLLLYPKKILDVIVSELKDGSFWSNISKITDPRSEVNRHGILHGIFTNFECRELALKFLILMDALAFIILADKASSGKL